MDGFVLFTIFLFFSKSRRNEVNVWYEYSSNVNLNDYIWDAGKYPNLSQMNKNVAEILTVDGQLIGIPRTRDIGRYGISYRQDWAEKVGVTTPPKTVDEVYNMLYKFTYEDPDGTCQQLSWIQPDGSQYSRTRS